MNEPDRRYQRYLVMAINAERAAQGLTIKELASRARIVGRTLLRINALERDIDFQQVAQLADALGVPVSQLALEAERRMGVGDPHATLVDAAPELTSKQKSALKGEIATHLSDSHTPVTVVRSKRRGRPTG